MAGHVPAFPEFQRERVYLSDGDRVGTDVHVPVGGMSLRDYFAGQALSGIVFAMTAEDRRRFRDGYSDGLAAETAYAIADAMLKAREPK